MYIQIRLMFTQSIFSTIAFAKALLQDVQLLSLRLVLLCAVTPAWFLSMSEDSAIVLSLSLPMTHAASLSQVR